MVMSIRIVPVPVPVPVPVSGLLMVVTVIVIVVVAVAVAVPAPVAVIMGQRAQDLLDAPGHCPNCSSNQRLRGPVARNRVCGSTSNFDPSAVRPISMG